MTLKEEIEDNVNKVMTDYTGDSELTPTQATKAILSAFKRAIEAAEPESIKPCTVPGCASCKPNKVRVEAISEYKSNLLKEL